MKKPQRRKSPIDMKRMSNWLTLFSGYRHGINEGRIDRWLSQFEQSHLDIAARTLDCVDFITNDQIASAFKSILNSLDGWSQEEDQREGRWRFIAYSVSAGESGDTMLHRFRLANGLSSRRFNNLFIRKSELLSEELGAEDTVIFVDDFSGTGDQVCNSWPEFKELLPGNPRVYLAIVVANVTAIKRIVNETDISLCYSIKLQESENIFSSKCKHFMKEEKEILLQYCQKGDRNFPKGYGDCGLVLVFAHDCPNNSIPILHKSHRRWEGLFRRHD